MTETPSAASPKVDALAAAVIAALVTRGQTLAVAESLTGGLLASTIVDVPGASAAFRGGLVVYATDLKASLADVDPALLAARGPVDPDVAAALAVGARSRCGADWGLSTTGVAGPTRQNDIAVGTVFIGISGPDGSSRAKALRLGEDVSRHEIRTRTVEGVLDWILTEFRP